MAHLGADRCGRLSQGAAALLGCLIRGMRHEATTIDGKSGYTARLRSCGPSE